MKKGSCPWKKKDLAVCAQKLCMTGGKCVSRQSSEGDTPFSVLQPDRYSNINEDEIQCTLQRKEREKKEVRIVK